MLGETDLNREELVPSTVSQKPSPHRRIIEPSKGWSALGLRELWEYRELIYFMVWREIQGRYRQTALGTSWLFIRPIANVLVLSLVFGKIVNVPTGEVPYPLFVLAAIIPWTYFSNAVQRAQGSLLEQRYVISKVYFPRLVLPIAGAISGLIDFAAAFSVLLFALLIYRMPLRVEILWIPGLLLVAVLFALTVGLWLATMSVKYQDVAFGVTFLLLAFMYLSPVIYPIDMVPENLLFIYQLNPMSGVIQGFRHALLGEGSAPGIPFLIGIGLTIIGLVSGAYVFRRTERTIVDVL